MRALPKIDDPAAATDERPPALHLVEDTSAAVGTSRELTGAWILLFGSLAACGGHGLFLVGALTRLSKVPSTLEVGGPLALAVIGWFVTAAPLALLALFARRPFQRLAPRAAWSLASLAALVGSAAFVLYMRAIALA